MRVLEVPRFTCSLLASLVLASLAAPAQAFQFRIADPNQYPVANIGAVRLAEPTAGAPDTGMPFHGTGILGPQVTPQLVPVDLMEALQPASAKIGLQTVLGVDTRMRAYTNTYPARAIALITFTGGYCTGWFYGPNIVATAGHCVHSGGTGGSWHTNVRVYPGYNAGTAPYGSFPAAWTASVSGWTTSGDERYDYGVVKLATNVGNTVGWFGYFWQAASLNGLPSIVAGYPGDKSPTQSQWMTADIVRATEERQVFYKDDTFGGQSGSAVWQDRPAGSAYCANGPCAYAIHAYGLHGSAPHSNHNHGTRITEAVSNNLTAWKNAAP